MARPGVVAVQEREHAVGTGVAQSRQQARVGVALLDLDPGVAKSLAVETLATAVGYPVPEVTEALSAFEDQSIARLTRDLMVVKIDPSVPLDRAAMSEAVCETCRRNNLKDGYIRLRTALASSNDHIRPAMARPRSGTAPCRHPGQTCCRPVFH